MKWCDTHFQWEIWLGNKLVATLVGDANDRDQSLVYRQVIDIILDPSLTFGRGIPHANS